MYAKVYTCHEPYPIRYHCFQISFFNYFWPMYCHTVFSVLCSRSARTGHSELPLVRQGSGFRNGSKGNVRRCKQIETVAEAASPPSQPTLSAQMSCSRVREGVVLGKSN